MSLNQNNEKSAESDPESNNHKEEESEDKQSKNEEPDDEESEMQKPKSDDSEEETKLIDNIKEKTNLLMDSKEEIISIIKYVFKLIQFHESLINVNLGLGDNNLTIKTCNTLLTTFTPLYALNIKVFIIPAINEACIRTDADVSFKVYPTNLLKIIITILKTENLRNLTIQVIRWLNER